MHIALITLVIAGALTPSSRFAQNGPAGPTNDKAQKTYKDAENYLHQRNTQAALEKFKKADKQDGGHCSSCQKQMIKYGAELGDWKTAELAGEEELAAARANADVAVAHYQLAVILMDEGLHNHKHEFFARGHDEVAKALAAVPKFPEAVFLDGRLLAQLRQDDAAKSRFEEYIRMHPAEGPDHQRAIRYVGDPELARARMVPAFTVTTLDGQHISMDDLRGKVVLLDFWATWCEPCREALPHVREMAKKFQGQPLVILSVSLDSDEQKWKEFIVKHDMTWPQYRDGGFTSPIAKMFNVNAIPHTFTIDADGVLQEEHIGDASIEGKLKKLIARARETQSSQNPVSSANATGVVNSSK